METITRPSRIDLDPSHADALRRLLLRIGVRDVIGCACDGEPEGRTVVVTHDDFSSLAVVLFRLSLATGDGR